ncbi:Golgi-body localization protein domain-containing protein [Elsinoe fawcettii]|nr:Golgi-body localization protein domain-containing protein [Elsinoe fawcettii]
MPLPTVSFVLGLGVLFYLSTFVLFALLRIITGVSVQRVSYSGLRRIAFSPRDGISIRIRGIGISLHRPTFAQPTWISLTLTEPRIILDLTALRAAQDNSKHHGGTNGSANGAANGHVKAGAKSQEQGDKKQRAHLFQRLTEWKERIKRLHRQIDWLRHIDVVMLRSSVIVKDVGSLRMERFTLSVDTRPKTVDRSRLFQHRKTRNDTARPAEWMSIVRSILLTVDGKESTEILDYCTLSVHGFLHKELDGLRDASIAVKMGRATVPYDDFESLAEKLRALRLPVTEEDKDFDVPSTPKIQLDSFEFQESAADADSNAVEAIKDSTEFANSILRGIQEVQLAVGVFGLSKRIKSLHTSGQHVYFNLAMKEVGLDIMRLDPRSPAHRMYFSPRDVAHQALLTAISIAAGLDDGHEHPERMVYIPMITATIKSTLPSKILQVAPDSDSSDKNTNILFANLVCTSPSVDVDPKHFPLVLAILKSKQAASPKGSSHTSRRRGHGLLSKLLPKATIKIAVQEPVVRVSLPKRGEEGDYDMIISSVSSMAMDIEAQHEASSQSHYSLSINYRHTIHRLYGQTFDGIRHELLFADTVEIKLDINAFPEMSVMVAGRFQNFSLFLIQPEICEGLRQIVLSLRRELSSASKQKSYEKQSFLRRAPAWLQHVHLEGSDFNVEVTNVEPSVSKYARGIGLHLESWSVEHKANREEVFTSVSRRRSTSRASYRESSPRQGQSSSPRRKNVSATDGRRLAVHIEGLEGLIIDSINNTQGDQFLALPRFEVAFSTSTDQHGPIFHINAKVEKLYVNYSLYNHFAIGIAFVLLKKTFVPSVSETGPSQKYNIHKTEHRASLALPSTSDSDGAPALNVAEITTIDVRAGLIQVKAKMPADPPLMLQIYGLEAGRHRWATPFMKSRLSRMYAGTPGVQSIWSRIISLKSLRLDLRTTRKKVGRSTVEEKSIDIAAEAIRIGVPHQLVVHSIFDNITNVVKVNEQLHHQFVTGSSDYVLDKKPEGPKHVPKITFRTQVMIFEIEDSPFEYKLGVIYRCGLLEQRQRLARQQAFELKAKRMNPKGQRRGSQARARSTRPLQRDKSSPDLDQRPRSSSARPSSRGRQTQSKLRYDTEGKCEMSGSVNRSSEQARDVLHRFNARSWKERIDRAWSTQRHAIKDIRSFFFGMDELPEEAEEIEPIMAMSLRPGLASLCISDLSIIVDKPSFPLKDLPQFMHDVGKGIPLDQQYSLLIPVHVSISMGEARAALRDYPLPLIHIPAIRSGQSPRLPSLALTTNFVIAEEYRNNESRRNVNVMVVPPDQLGPGDPKDGYQIMVRRTISPVKTYSNMKVDINTSAPTRITWGTSYQPAIQDMMQVIEGFTKPPIDPSDRVGFWDKIRLSFHSRILVSWKGDGDVHLNLKGSRDPYIVTGDGSGFVMVWRNNVRWKIAQDGDPKKFMTVDSGDYILAIPDYDHYARHVLDTEDITDNSASSADSMKSTAMFKKVVMKLSGNVQWLLGLMFEQSLDDGKRRFDFKNHYDVVLKHPKYAKAFNDKPYDAYHGFRSQHIHMSIAVAAPHSRDWNVLNVKPSDNYNSVHLTPRFFTHFLKWWSLFSGVMSLPVRQGPLWGSQEKSSKKFGRHLATIKYNLLLSPVFISHMYKHKDAEDFSADSVAVTGLKMKIDSFMLDLHQRREYFEIPGNKDGEPKRTSGMRINQGQLDFISGDFRAVSANIRGTSKEDVEHVDEDGISTYQSTPVTVDMSRFTIPDNDFTWIDMDDFVELDWILPQESNPETKILPLGSAPRFTYFRQTDHGDSVSGDTTRSSPFGDEPTHYCVMSKRNDPRQVQADLIQQRLDKIMEQISNNERSAGDAELKIIRDATSDQKLHEDLANLKKHAETLRSKHAFLHGMLKTLQQRLDNDDSSAVPGLETQEPALNRQESEWRDAHMAEGLSSVPLADESGEFNNRFVVHNAQIKWNNSLRNIILRYIHQVGQRRGFVYYMSRRAVKFILDIIEEKKRAGHAPMADSSRKSSQVMEPLSPQQDDDMTVEDRIAQILSDGKAFVEADDADRHKSTTKTNYDANNDEISTEFVAQNTYHFRLIAPQIQLQSEKNPKSVILIAAKGMHLKVIQIMDKDRVMDEISGLVQRRFNAAMDSMQVFVASTKTFSTDYLHMYSGNRYGTKAGSFWPPWVPLEVMYEFSVNPYGFSRVVQRTSASLRYDKYNNLRLKYNDDISKGQTETDGPEHRMDHLTVEFPQFRAICDSAQYYAMYIIAMDLLLYNEPLEKTRSERLEKIMLASDFSDLTGAPEMVEMLQSRIRQLEEIKMHFQIHEKLLDRQGWKDRIAMDHDLTSCEDELFFMMKAITTSQQRTEDRGVQDASSGILHWLVMAKELAWHLVREQDQKFLEFQIRDTTFERTDNNDGSNSNVVEFGRINGYNFLPNAIYRDLIAPYVDEKEGIPELREDNKMLRVQWLMLEAIAGIPVVDYFEVDMVPVRVQLEREVAKRLFEYIFPGVGGSAFEGSGFSPFMVKKMLPSTEDSDDALPSQDGGGNTPIVPIPEEKHHQGTGTGAGTLESRLQPTLRLSDPKSPPKVKHRGLGISDSHGNLSAHWSLFQHKNRSSQSVQRNKTAAPSTPTTKPSNLSITSRNASQTSMADDLLSPNNTQDKEKRKTSAPSIRKSAELTRSGSKSKKDSSSITTKDATPSQSDDLTLMLSRASNYITLSYFHIHSLILCLSYKGQGKRNIEDVHDLVFRLPSVEYRNKTWSNLDLAMELKREVLKALVGHAGRIVGNKFRRAPGRVQGRVEGMRESLFLSSSTGGGAKVGRVSEDLAESYGEGSEVWGKSQSDGSSVLGRSGTRERGSSVASGQSRGSTPGRNAEGGERIPPGMKRSATGQNDGERQVDRGETEGPSISLNGTPLRQNSVGVESNGDNRSLKDSIRRFSGLGSRSRSGTQGSSGSHSRSPNGTNGNGNAEEEKDEGGDKRKSRLLLGGSKLFNKFSTP